MKIINLGSVYNTLYRMDHEALVNVSELYGNRDFDCVI